MRLAISVLAPSVCLKQTILSASCVHFPLFAFVSYVSYRSLVREPSISFTSFCGCPSLLFYVFSTELMRTEVRATALGVLAAVGRCGSVAAQFVNGKTFVLDSTVGNIACLFSCTFLALDCFFCFFSRHSTASCAPWTWLELFRRAPGATRIAPRRDGSCHGRWRCLNYGPAALPRFRR